MAEITRLTHEEINSSAWKKIKAWAEQELAQLRVSLEADQTPERTSKLRGQIRSLVLLLALESPAPAIVDDDAE
jgi:hypothetical protein